jgi:hypothetical protein
MHQTSLQRLITANQKTRTKKGRLTISRPICMRSALRMHYAMQCSRADRTQEFAETIRRRRAGRKRGARYRPALCARAYAHVHDNAASESGDDKVPDALQDQLQAMIAIVIKDNNGSASTETIYRDISKVRFNLCVCACACANSSAVPEGVWIQRVKQRRYAAKQRHKRHTAEKRSILA